MIIQITLIVLSIINIVSIIYCTIAKHNYEKMNQELIKKNMRDSQSYSDACIKLLKIYKLYGKNVFNLKIFCQTEAGIDEYPQEYILDYADWCRLQASREYQALVAYVAALSKSSAQRIQEAEDKTEVVV